MKKESLYKINPRKPSSYKISKLIDEGFSPKQAIAIALNMEKTKKLGPRGGYKRNPTFSNQQEFLKMLNDLEKTGKLFWNRMSNGNIIVCVRGKHGNDPDQWLIARDVLEHYGPYGRDIVPDLQSGHIVVTLSDPFWKKNPRSKKNPPNQVPLKFLYLYLLANNPKVIDTMEEDVISDLVKEDLYDVENKKVTKKGFEYLESIIRHK